MTHVQKRGLCWLIAAVMTAAMMVFVLLCTDVTFAANDDSSIMRALMGYESGEPARVHLFIHGLITLPLALLGTWFPGLPWFTYAQLMLLALSAMVIAKSIMQSFVKHRQPLVLGALTAAAFLIALCMKYVTLLTFTQTAAMLGAAAAAQMLSIEHERGAKHVRELIKCRADGYGAHITFVVQMRGMKYFAPNAETDPDFAAALKEARAAGVEIIALECAVTPDSMEITGFLPVRLD